MILLAFALSLFDVFRRALREAAMLALRCCFHALCCAFRHMRYAMPLGGCGDAERARRLPFIIISMLILCSPPRRCLHCHVILLLFRAC